MNWKHATLIGVMGSLLLCLGCVPQAEQKGKAEAEHAKVNTVEMRTEANNLGGFHTRMEDADSCATCHGDQEKIKVDDSETAINERCVECHGGYEDLAKEGAEIDPHNSHLGDINCTTCHRAHTPSVLYCNKCHSFADLEIPYAQKQEEVTQPWFTGWDQKKIQAAIDAGPVESTDVVVIGAGSAGYNAALMAQKGGSKVILLEMGPFTGGNSLLAAGGINAVGTKAQKAHGIVDKKEWFIEDAMKGGRYANDPKLVQILADQSNDAIEWMESLGVNLDDLKRSGGARVNRTHRPAGGKTVGPAIIAAMRKAADERGVDTRLNSRAEKLVINDNKEIVGVVVHGKYSGYYMISAKAAVLATGGYGYNFDMISYYRPTFKNMTSSNNVTATGDGIHMAKEIGASMTDIDWVQAHPTIGMDSRILVSETVRGVGAVMVNKNGARFISELTTRDRASDAILKQPGKFAWLIFDNQLYAKTKMVQGYDHLKMLKKADTIEGLAKATGMDPATLEKTVADYNRYQKAGKDEAFDREDMPLNMTQKPYYAVKVAPGIHHTMGGVAIDTKTEVLDLQSHPIPGLYAAGEVTGGVHGFNRLGGNAIADTIVFGRIAGEDAAKYVKQLKEKEAKK